MMMKKKKKKKTTYVVFYCPKIIIKTIKLKYMLFFLNSLPEVK